LYPKTGLDQNRIGIQIVVEIGKEREIGMDYCSYWKTINSDTKVCDNILESLGMILSSHFIPFWL